MGLRLKEGVRRRVLKAVQEEAAGAADAGVMQIEWSERGGVEVRGVVKAGGGVAGARAPRGVDGRSEPRRGQEEDVWVERRHTSARRSEARRQCGCGRVISCIRGQKRWRTKFGVVLP